MSRSTEDLIAERNATHGDSHTQMTATGKVWGALLQAMGWTPPEGSDGALLAHEADMLMIGNKLSRASVGNAAFVDHWDDIRGYATLAQQHSSRDA